MWFYVFIHKRIYSRCCYKHKLNLKKTTTQRAKLRATISPHQMNRAVDEWRSPAAPSAALFLRLRSCGPLLPCKTSEGLLTNSGEEKKTSLKSLCAFPQTQASKACVRACEINSVDTIIGCKLNYWGSLTEHDLRKMRYSFRFSNTILGSAATLLMRCLGLRARTYLSSASPPAMLRRGASGAAGEQPDRLPLWCLH